MRPYYIVLAEITWTTTTLAERTRRGWASWPFATCPNLPTLSSHISSQNYFLFSLVRRHDHVISPVAHDCSFLMVCRSGRSSVRSCPEQFGRLSTHLVCLPVQANEGSVVHTNYSYYSPFDLCRYCLVNSPIFFFTCGNRLSTDFPLPFV